ncbi:MAG: BolA family transcriptional regulator [Alphaproteobacteria bacterium]|jgi:stress-induced morphogen|nr:BolA family transcriptional regulator [Alphaproteobacteria bacterium]MDP7182396.1 BolA family transcriptional regulator [Alphaproteobacteria bacterium]MDP7191158.1 BolA family transcriptional regulator [Alphaproteobacteria bacterium]MDP7456646.1 BolA family transcriptional regulator [Alphaproteobacteria bacterium]HJO88643.1 BolA family transcriptional regulator [Alphaproteobacteria bacterium]|tara:strand:+ start:1501 stop:1743 length:243 start_codon:yes stop_codon:yes gene_type:complete
MAIEADKIVALIEEAIPGSNVTIEDLRGDGDHYGALVVSDAFEGLSRVQQHQMVYKALGDLMGGELHALAIQTATSKNAD